MVAEAIDPELCVVVVRHKTLQASMTGYAYLRERLFGDLEGYPWCLTRGDVKSNILALLEREECPADS
eukprot:6455912-Amphidinium_carterae.1